MVNAKGTDIDIGKSIKKMREARGMSRAVLAECANISDSHLKKIESGARKPGIDTYQSILNALNASIVIENGEEQSVIGNCIQKAKAILMDCSEKQAQYLVSVLEFSADYLKLLNCDD